MADLTATYYTQGYYIKAETINIKVLDLQREVLKEKHPDTISAIVNLTAIYYTQGHYAKAETIYIKMLDL